MKSSNILNMQSISKLGATFQIFPKHGHKFNEKKKKKNGKKKKEKLHHLNSENEQNKTTLLSLKG